MKQLYSKVAALLLMILAGCLEPYQPPSIPNVLGYLVVDGFVNSSDGTVTVRLSRTSAISGTPQGEPGGNVVLERSSGGSSVIPDIGGGTYSGAFAINPAVQYRLRIKTKNKDYLSDFISLTTTPPIDSVFWEADPVKEGVQIYIASHDPAAKSKNYQWDYVETWKYDAFYPSNYWIQGGKIVMRPANKGITTCWTTVNSTSISIYSTEKQSQDIVKYPLLFIPKNDPRISSIHGIYSIFVRQHVITPVAFTFWQQLQKTTENLGGLFDPLPNQVVGNMHGPVNSPDPVLGYFSGGTISQKRIYIDLAKLPEFLKFKPEGCGLRDLEGQGAPPLSEYPDGYPVVVPSGPAQTSDGACVDCRISGGTTVKPSFWP